MRFSAVALVGFAAIAYAQEIAPDATVAGGPAAPDAAVEGGDADEAPVDPASLFTAEPFGFPPGVPKPGPKDLPKFGPPKDKSPGKDKLPVWHPPHKGIFIDDCDDDKDDKWHWAHKGSKHPKPIIPHHKWGVSTITATKTKTVFDCGPHVPECPGKPKTKYTTTTVVVTTTVCPVPITDIPAPPPKPTKPAPPPAPAPPQPTKPGLPSPPPAVTPGPVVPDVPAVSKPPVIISAGGAAQNAAGALAAVAAFVAALI